MTMIPRRSPEGAPPRGTLSDGSSCRCPCHGIPGAVHVVACCGPPYGRPDDILPIESEAFRRILYGAPMERRVGDHDGRADLIALLQSLDPDLELWRSSSAADYEEDSEAICRVTVDRVLEAIGPRERRSSCPTPDDNWVAGCVHCGYEGLHAHLKGPWHVHDCPRFHGTPRARHDCEAYRDEGVGCSKCNAVAREIRAVDSIVTLFEEAAERKTGPSGFVVLLYVAGEYDRVVNVSGRTTWSRPEAERLRDELATKAERAGSRNSYWVAPLGHPIERGEGG